MMQSLDSCNAATAAVNGRKVLIVDDNVDTAELMALLLSTYGHAVDTAADADTAMRLAAEIPPDVILLDIALPGTDGYMLAQALRCDARFRHTLLVALTGYGSAGDLERSIAAGFDHHMVKPAQIEQLLALIELPLK